MLTFRLLIALCFPVVALYAFAQKNFSPAGAQSMRGRAPQKFTYRTADASTVVDTSGYFNAVANLLEVGDLIEVVVVDDADTPTGVTGGGTHVVLSNAAGVVDVSNVGAALVVTDTD